MSWYARRMDVVAFALGKMTFPKQIIMQGGNALEQLAALMQKNQHQNILVVTDKNIVEKGLFEPCVNIFAEYGIAYTLFDTVEAEPDYTHVREGVEKARACGARGIMALGGGSVLDAAKAIAVLHKTPHFSMDRNIGIHLGRQKKTYLYMVPTTAGTGAESSAGVVLADERGRKNVLMSRCFVPEAVALDTRMTVGLPFSITAQTGFDALSHLVEGLASRVHKPAAKEEAVESITHIFYALPRACADGGDISARKKMAYAAHRSGALMNSLTIGYCHAFGHKIGGLYHIPHGQCMAALLPEIAEYNVECAKVWFAKVAERLGLWETGMSEDEAARAFTQELRKLRDSLGLRRSFPELGKDDIPAVVEAAFAEAQSSYAVCKYMGWEEAGALLEKLSG